MDYEKLHKDTIAKLQEMVNSGKITVETARGICADFVPESEDERIRKELIRDIDIAMPIETAQRYIAWLEKQGNLMKALQISNAKIGELIEKNYYLKEQLEKQDNNMGISEATKKKLEDNLNKALEKETPESCNEFLDEQSEQKPVEEYNITGIGSKNATGKLGEMIKKKLEMEKQGEQKHVFEMKTPEESLGVDSDTYNKIVDECVYGEQKPIKEHNACEFCEDRYGCVIPCSMKLIKEEKPTDKIESRQEELTEFEKVVKQVMEEAIECGDTHNLKADADMLLRLVQKSTWSEEDKLQLDAAINIVSNSGHTCTSDWLKSLKDRVQPKKEWKQENTDNLTDFENAMMHIGGSFFGDNAGLDPNDTNAIKEQANLLLELIPSKEWSKEDNRMCKAIINNIQAICEEGYFVGNIDSGELIEWLKSLRPQSQWKPSDEQMDALRYVTNFDYGGYKATLVSLYEQLKKLRGE